MLYFFYHTPIKTPPLFPPGAAGARSRHGDLRREIRSLTDEDREAFFDTMEIWYTIPTSEGKVKYGSKFENYERVTAYHDAKVT